MKQLLLLFLCLFVSNTYAQLTYVPDDHLEAYLETTFPICSDGTSNDYVLTSGLSSVSTIAIFSNNYPVVDFTGLENCNNLVGISVQNSSYCTNLDFSMVNSASPANNTITLDISYCPYLVSLKAPQTSIALSVEHCNQINNIELYPTTSLSSVAVSFCNSLEVLDFSMVSSVQYGVFTIPQIAVGNNAFLSCINLQNGYCNIWAVASFSGDNLTCIQVDDPTYCVNATNWSSELLLAGGAGTYSLNCGGCTTSLEDTKLESKKVVRVTDLLGRETVLKPNTPLIYIYSDGTTERVFNVY